jgi:hypothetical protein
MTPSAFVDALKSEVRDAAATDTIAQIKSPSGRRPNEAIRRLSEWFNQLSPSDQNAVAEVAAMTAHSAVFGFLCVLDGARAIEDGKQKGSLELNYIQAGEDIIRLNPLHDLLNAQ